MNTRKLSKARMILILLALFLSTSCTMGDMVIVPIAGNLYDVFPQVGLVNAIISAPALIGVPFCLLGGYLSDKMNKKILMVIGFALYTVTSVFGCAFENVYFILVCRLIATGVAWGLTSSAALGIIAELYEDEGKRGPVNGWYNAVMAALGSVLSLVAGYLAVSAWQNAFRAYWINIPILILLVVFLPSMPAEKKEASAAEEVKKGRTTQAGWMKGLIPILIQVLLVASSYYVITYMISVYVIDTGIGNEAFSGTLSSAGTICSFLANLAFGLIYSKLKKATAIPSFIAIGAGFLLMAFFPSRAVALVVCALMGGFWGIFYSFFFTECSVVVPEEKQGTAIGITSAVNGIAMFLCTYLVTGLKSVMKAESVTAVFPVFGIVVLGVCVYVVLLLMRGKKREAA